MFPVGRWSWALRYKMRGCVDMAQKENKANKSVFFRMEAGDRFDSQYKTIITPDNFDEAMNFVDEETGDKMPYEVFEKCVFIGCDFNKMDNLRGSLFDNCAFIDCDFSGTNPYKTAFLDCEFENNDWHGRIFPGHSLKNVSSLGMIFQILSGVPVILTSRRIPVLIFGVLRSGIVILRMPILACVLMMCIL